MLTIEAQLVRLEESIVANNKFLFSLVSCIMILVIFLNLTSFQLPFFGIVASLVYLLINATFLGYGFFRKESPFLRFVLGLLMLIMLIGLIGWLTMIAWNLDVTRSVVVLFIVNAFCFVIGLMGKHPRRNLDSKEDNQQFSQRSRIISISYLLLVSISLYLLLLSRSGEVHTVWEALNPLFIPVYVSATFLLLSVIFSPGNLEKILLVAGSETGHPSILMFSYTRRLLPKVSIWAPISPAGNMTTNKE